MEEETRKEAIVTFRRYARSMNGSTAWKKGMVLGIFILGLLCSSQAVQAQEYPTQPITMLISNAPGAGTDVCSRVMAQGASKILNQEIIPMNKPGAGGAVAVAVLTSSKPDGYTILGATSSSLTVVPQLETVTYDPLKDVVPIIHFGTFHQAIIVRADSPLKSFKDFIEFARNNPGKANLGIVGVGNPPHLDFELVKMQEKVDIAVIPFGGAAPAITALLGGHVTAVGVGASGWMPNYKAGKVRVLATTTEKRILPDVPALREFGYPFYGISTEYYFMAAPKGISEAIVKKLEGAFIKVMGTPEFRTTTDSFFVYDPNPLSRQVFKDLIESLYRKNGEIIQKAKLGKQG
jgi:tripartite-type tricarboxylate transporter receptor subunit TctC